MTECVVLSTQRSGSTLVVDYLSSAPGVLVHSELFQNLRKDLVGTPQAERHYAISYKSHRKSTLVRKLAHRFCRRMLIEKYLEKVYAARPGVDVVGMKFMYNQASKYPEVLAWLQARRVFFIHVVRENLLAMMVSRKLAELRGTYSMNRPLEAMKVHLNIGALIAEFERKSAQIALYREFCAGLPSREVTYEAFVADKIGETRRLLDFLGAGEHEPTGSKIVKTNPHAMRDVIINFDEVARVLQSHPRFCYFLT